jgi:methenyltetrahydrofolate cyclohydrolase
MRVADDFLDQPLSRFFESVASESAAPGGGAAAAVTVALAAGLSAMAARLSESQLQGSAQLVDQAEGLRQRATELAQEDMMAFEAVHAAYALPKDQDPEGRRRQIRAALVGATDVPLEIAEVAAQVAELAGRLARGGNPNLKGDAVTGALLALAGARSASALVELNVRQGQLEGPWRERAEAHVATATQVVDRSLQDAGLGREHA